MKQRPGEVIVYAAKMNDGTFRCVEAVSHDDARRYLGGSALSIRKRSICLEDHLDVTFNDAARRDVFEIGHVRPENHGSP